ncbi:GspE/PulE family protein [Humisphaera borealis]|uniref:Flp pilus assembly complex ATPase component TadA n=1 Tax=Humisphaera borealis TaxID=2807512 RepID=A0A7M2X2R9_9BACT|nr:ATPase, T2SS/T4P/T4SS family [Humisphaera borealis]QOV92048.1 Flp pilus assembly complex ATPase component TadA [Humisphaera borealis]
MSQSAPQSSPVTPASAAAGGGAPSPGTPGRRVRLGEALVLEGVLTQEQLARALAQQKNSGRLLGEMLVEQNVISGAHLVQVLARTLGVKGVQLRHGLIDPTLFKLFGAEEAERLLAIPMFKVHGTLTVAMTDPQNLPKIDRIRQLTNCRVRTVLAIEANIKEFIKKYAAGETSIDAFLTSLSEQDVEVVDRESVDEGPTTDLDKMVAGSPIINLVNVALLTAIRDKASDIHIEPDKKGSRIRYRIDGVLRDLMKPPAGMHAAIVSRIKVIGKMDVAEKRLPQEGRVHIVAEGREIDLRVSSMPTLLGEKLVLRILDKANLKVRLDELGFRPEALASFRRMLEKPHGLVLVTGPTGSGKTTTLYSALDLVRSPELNIVTIEDPVEYQLDLVNQTHVHDQIGLSFAKALRSILRQDPDVIMVGEIRDQETAHVAVQAALTGHLVLATLHTNDAVGAVARLLDMGIEPYLLSSALNGVVAQRLARSICPSCATKYYPSEKELADAGLADKVGRAFRKGGGCQSCHDSGFQSRFGVYEVMEVTPELRRMVHKACPSHELRAEFRKWGGRTLREEGVAAALDGQSSLEEVLRVTTNEDADAHEEGAAKDKIAKDAATAAAAVLKEAA